MLAIAGCGGSGFDTTGGTDNLTMQFLGFTGEGIMQEDYVGNTSADVDICASICAIGGDLVGHRVRVVHADARERDLHEHGHLADPARQVHRADPRQRHPGRRPWSPRRCCPAARAATRRRGSAAATATAAARHLRARRDPVEILLYSFVTKELVRGDKRCPRSTRSISSSSRATSCRSPSRPT